MRRLGFIKQDTLSFSYHIVDHCNLKCKGCDNYSSIAPQKNTDIRTFERDLSRIKEVMGDKITSILLLGGEPLLNTSINDYLICARRIFFEENIEIAIVTNGILLNRMPEEFWCCCCENHIIVSYTKYPIDIDLKAAEKKADQFSVVMRRYGRENEGEKTLQFDPFDIKGSQDIETNFKNCFHANKCIQLYEGKLFTCNIRAYVDIYCKHFGIKMETSDKDYIDIYSDVTADDILSFLSKPIPFCRYCNISRRNEGHIWRVSNENASAYDWMLFEFDENAAKELERFSKVIFALDDGVDEEKIWNRSFARKDNYVCLRITEDEEQSLYGIKSPDGEEAGKTAIVIVCDKVEKTILHEKDLVQKGYRNIYYSML